MTTDPLPDDLFAKATPRPWRIAEDDRKIQPWTDTIAIEAPNDPDGSIPPIVCWMMRGGDNEANAALIVAAVNAYTGREREVVNTREVERRQEAEAELCRLKDHIHVLCPDHEKRAKAGGCRDGMLYFSDGTTAGICEWRGHALGGHT